MPQRLVRQHDPHGAKRRARGTAVDDDMGRAIVKNILFEPASAWLEPTLFAINPIAQPLRCKNLLRAACDLNQQFIAGSSNGVSESRLRHFQPP